ncbi:MAG: FAD-dependent oxidoreductase [Thermoplasmata archaeon]
MSDPSLRPIPSFAPGRYLLPLLENRVESPTARTFRFSTVNSGFQYRSNQAIRLSLPGVDDPWGAVRTFSLSSSPTENGVLAVTCKITDTPFKQALARLEPGATAEVIGPLGHFLFDPSRPSIFLAGGIGITPFRGMLRFASDTGIEHELRLLYSARTPEELLFRGELDAMAAALPHLRVSYSVTRPAESEHRWTGRTGRIDVGWIREAADGLDRPRYFVAGLPEMVEQVVGHLRGSFGVPDQDILYEMFRGF